MSTKPVLAKERPDWMSGLDQFFDWCKTIGIKPDQNNLVTWDETVNPGTKVLDYERAKQDGFYGHLKRQAASLLSMYRVSGRIGTLRSQGGGYITNEGFVPVPDMTGDQVTFVIGEFKKAVKSRQLAIYEMEQNAVSFRQLRKQIQKATVEATAEAATEATQRRKKLA